MRLLPYFARIHTADITQQQLALEFSDRNRLPLGTLLTRDQEHTSVVPLNQVSSHFIHAILAAEDGDFYDHGALDMKAAARALKDAIARAYLIMARLGETTPLITTFDQLEPHPPTPLWCLRRGGHLLPSGACTPWGWGWGDDMAINY